jgi:hypothetical protein
MRIAARTRIPVRVIAAIINQCGTKVVLGSESPKMDLSTLLNNGHFFAANFNAPIRKGMLRNKPKLMKSHGLSPDLMARKVR